MTGERCQFCRDIQDGSFPKSIFFIVLCEFCERFSYYGMRTVLTLYFFNELMLSENEATGGFHTFAALNYFFPVVGAIISDSPFGKFRTIFYLSIVYVIGNVVITLGSLSGVFNIPSMELTIIGLILIAIGSGGIKPCVSAFGGEQFVLPDQDRQLKTFFSIFYFSINTGSLLSTILAPVFRRDVHCFGQPTCYPLAFGVPAILMFVALIAFFLGKPWYKIVTPEFNVTLNSCNIVGHALRKKCAKDREPRVHWLDHAEYKHGREQIGNIKQVFKICCLYVPLPMFWALYDQQGSKWTIQAENMNGNIGFYTVKPDHMQLVNPLLIIILIPVVDIIIYPLFEKCHFLKTPLQRMVAGGILASIAFIVSATLEIYVEPTKAVVPQPGEGQLRLFNTFNCPMNINVTGDGLDERMVLGSISLWQNFHLEVKIDTELELSLIPDSSCPKNNELTSKIKVFEKEATSYTITSEGAGDIILEGPNRNERIKKLADRIPYLKVLYTLQNDDKHELKLKKNEKDVTEDLAGLHGSKEIDIKLLDYGTFDVSLNDKIIMSSMDLQQGGMYYLLIYEDESNDFHVKLEQMTSANTIHIAWLLPQTVVITFAELLMSIPGLHFSFTQAPATMKTLIQAMWLVVSAFGNVIVVIISNVVTFSSDIYYYLLYSGLNLLATGALAVLAVRYKYVDADAQEEKFND